MATVRKNIPQFSFLRNKEIYNTRSEAINNLRQQLRNNRSLTDGSIILARYRCKYDVRTIVGVVYSDGIRKSMSILKLDSIINDADTNDDSLHYAELYKKSQPAN